MAPFEEKTRDTHAFARRVGDLPVQLAGDGDLDYRGALHRDGTVFCAVSPKELAQADVSGARSGAACVYAPENSVNTLCTPHLFLVLVSCLHACVLVSRLQCL